MYDKGKIIIGLIIFFSVLTFPFWYNMGAAAKAPDPKLSEKAKQAKTCVADTDYMRKDHMQLLNTWRTEVVRNADRVYVNANGKSYMASLTNTCLDCHNNKAEFCDQCHNYASVSPYCWDCHRYPEEKK